MNGMCECGHEQRRHWGYSEKSPCRLCNCRDYTKETSWEPAAVDSDDFVP